MKRKLNVFFLAALMASLSMSCSKEVAQEEEDVVDTTEQVAFDDVEVEDYTVLSYSELEVLAYEGDTEAQVMLGRMLEYGTEDVRQNFAEAISWYQMASDSGNPEGTNALGYFYLTGTGIDKDLNRAKELFQTAVDGGIVNAKVGLARVMLAEGDYEALALQNLMEQEELKQDESKKEEVKEEKQENKKEEPKQEDSKKEETEDNDQEQQSEEETSSEENNELAQIVNLLTEAQKAGDLDGGYYLGYIYEKGIGVTQDYKKAFDYYNRVVKSTSTALNDRDSINLSNISLGLMYIKGYGVEANTEVALGYFQTASDNWSAKASYYIGQMYENAIGVDKDYEKAMEYYLKAADLDFAPALNQIGYLYYNGYGVDVDFASAVYYQKLAALQGYAIAQVNLGFLYENGYGVERNLETALSYYEMAANSGYEGATEAVVRVKAQINEEM